MEEHLAGQMQTLVEVEAATGNVEHPRRSRVSHRCFQCVVGLLVVMGLIIMALLVGFILHYSAFRCNQETPPVRDTGKLKMECELKKSEEDGRYNIFTATKAGQYLIYGWVRLSHTTNKILTLRQTKDGSDRVLETQTSKERNFFFFSEARLTPNTTICMDFQSIHNDSLFHVYEL